MVKSLCLLAVALGFLAGALGDAMHAEDAFWASAFITMLVVGLAIFGWVTWGLAAFVSTDPVDLEVDAEVWSRYDDSWHDHHSGEC